MKGISVLICTHNGSARLGPVLAALQAQTGLENRAFEVVLVDNASTDDTAAMARKLWGDSPIELRTVREDRQELRHARKTGYLATRHDLICWVDDDNVLSPGYLALAAKLMEDHPLAGVCGGNGQLVCSAPVPEWLAGELGTLAIGPQGPQEGRVSSHRQFVYGAGCILRRAALEELYAHDFQPVLLGNSGPIAYGGEDLEISFALGFLGWQVIHSPRLTFEHRLKPERLTWDYCHRLYYLYGHATALNNLYFMFVSDTFKQRLKRAKAGRLLTYFYNQIAAAWFRLFPAPEKTTLALHRQSALGRAAALRQLRASGELNRIFSQIRELHRRCTPLRLQRQGR